LPKKHDIIDLKTVMKESTDEFDKLSTKIGELEKDKLLAEKRVQGEVERANVAETEKENIERSLTKVKNEYDEYKRVAG
jgi:chromosome segregation ATPase